MMREDETYADLTSLFAAEDRALESGPFVDEVMNRVRRRARLRRVVLALTGTAGAMVAAFQLPAFFSGWTGADAVVTHALASARNGATLLETADPLWLGIGAVVVLSLLAVTTMERA